MRLLGIDYGSKRVGVALSDEGGEMAFPHDVFLNDAELVKNITGLAEAKQVEKIIVGHSLDREGKDNPIHGATEEFISELTSRLSIPIELEPEQYTTKEAVHTQGKHEKIDASAAALILNSYITRTKETK